ncbi:PREDICTED: serine/threonine-protein kinase 26-like [Nelumbo nucifera]|uniref:Serine/threonine-protein kinase 26-like n=2 Tax=Nelumbo nucifera TaxID=4432 RepID=A0A1U8Q442_NELNU|nr:PREDICTED: serine/threonine-protein kinase 26-like [Nelumbo nucifera]DAD26255.1 TPA_asm: hypothetical protein HUJ06_027723 [Nelumbo nucifera]
MEKQQLRWSRGNYIGKGSFGIVSLATDESDGRIFAVKSVDPNSSVPSHLESLENEIRVLKSLSSPYVVEYLGDDLTQETATTWYRNLHMEYLPGGTVADLSTQFGGKGTDVDERIVQSYTWCIVSALWYVHARGIVHCDVKGRNVLVGSTPGVAKLADFGSAKRIFGGGANNEEEGMILPRGTPLWMAPEVIRRDRQGPEADVWSLGCTVIEMITGKPAWQDCGGATATMCRIGFSNELPDFPAKLSALGRDFLDKCLRREPSERWTCEQLLRHPFVSAGAITEPSPRCVLDWPNSEFYDDEEEEEEIQVRNGSSSHNSEVPARERLRGLTTGRRLLWESDGWEVVRQPGLVCDRGEGTCGGGVGRDGTSSEYSNLVGNKEEEAGISSESRDFLSGGEESEGTSPEFFNSVVCLPCGEWLNCVIICSGSGGGSGGDDRADSDCQHEQKMGFYGWCKLLLLIHLMKTQISFIIFILGFSSSYTKMHVSTVSISLSIQKSSWVGFPPREIQSVPLFEPKVLEDSVQWSVLQQRQTTQYIIASVVWQRMERKLMNNGQVYVRC